MTTIHFVHPDGRSQSIEADDGQSAMMAATGNGIDEIVAECGGNAMCATCHVYVDPDWYAVTGEPDDMESDMLEITVAERKPTSRLSCQIQARPELDGLVLRVPQV